MITVVMERTNSNTHINMDKKKITISLNQMDGNSYITQGSPQLVITTLTHPEQT